jgi:N-acetylglucosaminyldiphosphoundecaprenol N-acetyl-beta-D-mannosaminyltransferase
MSESVRRTISPAEVQHLYQRFQRVALVSTASYLTKFPQRELDAAVKLFVHAEIQQLHRRMRSAAFVSALGNVPRLEGPALPSIDNSDHAPAPNKQDVYLAFRQAVLTSSANVLREQQATSLRQAVNILNVEIDNLSMQEFLGQLDRGVVFTPNVDHLMKLQHDPAFVAAYQQADYRVCDSQVLLYAAKFLGDPIKAKISGSDLFPQFCAYHANNDAIKIFLLGGAAGIAAQARDRINHRTGREIIVAAHSPSFGFEKNPRECLELVQMIRRSTANVLVVGVGAPKQEIWITKHRHMLPNIDIFLAVGAAIDFEAGNKPRSPEWMSQLGIEWIHRLASEPQRLWKRYLIEDMPFFALLFKQKLRKVFTKSPRRRSTIR